MELYIYNMGFNKIGQLTSNNPNESAFNIKLLKKFNDSDELTFEIPFKSSKHKLIDNDNYVMFDNEIYTITKPQYSHSDNKISPTITCFHLSSILKKKILMFEKNALVGINARTMLNSILLGSGFEVGFIDVNDSKCRSITKDSEGTVFSYLTEVATLFDGKLNFRTQLVEEGSTKIIKRYVDLYSEKPNRNIIIRSGLNLRSLQISYDTEELITRLYCFGGNDTITKNEITIIGATDSSGNKVTKSYIDNYEYYTKKGIDINYIKANESLFLKEGLWRDNNYIDSQSLYDDSVKKLEKLSKPKIECSFEMLDLRNVEGYKHLKVPIVGEVVTVIDEKLCIEYITYVTEVTMDYSGNGKTQVTTSNEIEYKNAIGEIISGKQDIDYILGKPNTKNFLDGVIEINQTALKSLESNWFTDTRGNIIFENPEKTKCLFLGGGMLALANSKTPTGEYNFRTFGTGDGFTADLIVAGTLKGGKVEFNLSEGKFLIGNSPTDYKMYYDGTHLKLGTGVTISWDSITGKDGLTSEIEGIKGQIITITGNMTDINNRILTADDIKSTIITKDYIGTLGLLVGEQIQMGANATINWSNVTGTKPLTDRLDGIDRTIVVVDGKFIGVDGKFTEVDKKILNINGNLVEVNNKFTLIDGQLVDINGRILTANDITSTIITKDYIKTLNLLVGEHILMGNNATLSWDKITTKPDLALKTDLDYTKLSNKPYIPTEYTDLNAVTAWKNSGYATYIDSGGVYTGTVVADRVISGTLSGMKITTKTGSNGYGMTIDQDRIKIGDSDSNYTGFLGIDNLLYSCIQLGFSNRNRIQLGVKLTDDDMVLKIINRTGDTKALRVEGRVDFTSATVTGLTAGAVAVFG